MTEPVKINFGSTDEEILARAKVEVTLAGRKYTWEEVGRRQARGLLSELFPIMKMMGKEEEDPSAAFALVDAILDYFYKHHEQMRADQKALNDDASNEEIFQALMAIQELLNLPFVRDLAEAKSPPEPNPQPENNISMENQKSTNS